MKYIVEFINGRIIAIKLDSTSQENDEKNYIPHNENCEIDVWKIR